MKINKGFLLIEVMIGFCIAIILTLALAAYIEGISYYRHAAHMLEQAICIGIRGMDMAVYREKEDTSVPEPFSMEYSSIKQGDNVSRVLYTIRWLDGRQKEKKIVFRSVLLEV